MINKFRLHGVQASRALSCFCFFCFCFFVENKAGTKITVGEISQAQQMHIQDLPLTCCTTANGTSCRRTGQIAQRGLAEPFGLAKPPLIPLNSSTMLVCATLASTPKF